MEVTVRLFAVRVLNCGGSGSNSGVIAGVKRVMDQGYFLMRTNRKVGTELSLTALAYNMRRVINIAGVHKMIEALG